MTIPAVNQYGIRKRDFEMPSFSVGWCGWKWRDVLRSTKRWSFQRFPVMGDYRISGYR